MFARFKISGKQVRKSLKTSNVELAKAKLAELERNERTIAVERRRGKMFFREAMDELLRSRKCRGGITARFLPAGNEPRTLRVH